MNEPSCTDFNFDIDPCNVCVERMWKSSPIQGDGICWIEYYHNEISRGVSMRDLVAHMHFDSPYYLAITVRNYFPDHLEDLNKLLILIG